MLSKETLPCRMRKNAKKKLGSQRKRVAFQPSHCIGGGWFNQEALLTAKLNPRTGTCTGRRGLHGDRGVTANNESIKANHIPLRWFTKTQYFSLRHVVEAGFYWRRRKWGFGEVLLEFMDRQKSSSCTEVTHCSKFWVCSWK